MNRRLIFAILFLIGLLSHARGETPKELRIEGNRLISQKPPFTSIAPSNLKLAHTFSQDNPAENSLTRVYFYIAERNKAVEEMFIVQIADKTNPQALPMTAPALKPYSEKGVYSKGKVKKGDLEIEYLLQLMAWNPEARSLEPIIKKGWRVPHQWALQGQYQFIYLGEHGVLIRYSKDIHTFGFKVSAERKDWESVSLSGNEKKAYQNFQKNFMEMINSIQLRD